MAHVIAACAPADVDAARAAGAYTAADGLGLDLPQIVVASL